MIKDFNNVKEYKFFSHTKCEFFPCHAIDNKEEFNCLFCYCPLYALGENCGGNFKYAGNGIKDCSECLIPHRKNNYDYIMTKFGDIADIMKKTD